MSKSLVVIIKVAILLGCFYYIFKDLSFGELMGYFSDFSLIPIILLGVYTLAVYWVSGLKINYFSHGEIGVKKSYFAVLIANAFNNIMPGKLGEVVKVLYLRQAHRIATSSILPAVLMDRFFDVNMMLLLILIAMVFSEHAITVWPFIAVIAVGWGILFLARWMPERFLRLIRIVRHERIRNALEANFNNLLLCLCSKMLLGGVGLTLIVWAAYYSIVGIFIFWVADLDLTLYQTFVIFVFSAIGYAIPAAPAGIGVYEATFVLAMGWYGVPKEQALAIGTILHLLQIIPASIAGLTIFFTSKMNIGNVLKRLRNQGE